MQCPSCGNEVIETDAKCGSCGSPLSSAKAYSTESAKQPLRWSGKAIASLILGMTPFAYVAGILLLAVVFDNHSPGLYLGFLGLPPIFGLLAVIVGHQARASVRGSAGRFGGGKIAATGLVLGYVGLACWILVIIPPSDNWVVAHEAGAVGSLRTINTAAITYAQTYNHGYPPTLAAMGPPKTEKPNASAMPNGNASGLINEGLASGTYAGYRFTYLPGPVDGTGKVQTYTVHADPARPGVSGRMYYFTDQTKVIRVEKGNEAHEHSPPIS